MLLTLMASKVPQVCTNERHFEMIVFLAFIIILSERTAKVESQKNGTQPRPLPL